MRISDWSSDVCSSDLLFEPGQTLIPRFHQRMLEKRQQSHRRKAFSGCLCQSDEQRACGQFRKRPPGAIVRFDAPARSEEHTSELQSLMRISYAVFCLKKKNKKKQRTRKNTHN